MSEALHTVLERAKRSPFYKQFLPSRAAWKDTPITTKAHLREAYPFGLLADQKNSIATYHESSGTEGKPIASYFSDKDWLDIASRFLRGAVNLNSTDLFFIKTPYSMVTTAHQAHRAARLAEVPVVPGDNRTTQMPYSRVVQLLRDLEVTVSWSLPTEVLYWYLAAKVNGFDVEKDFPKFRAFWVAGEALSSNRRKQLELLWPGKKVYEDYGSTETGSLAGECTEGKLHLWADRVHFEVFDEKTGAIGQFGRGKLLVTPLYRTTMPLVRYLLEDEVLVTSSSCSCGSELPTISVFGRSSSRVRLGQRTFFPVQVENIVYAAGLDYRLLYWKGYASNGELEIDFTCEGNGIDCGKAIEAEFAIQQDVRVNANFVPLDNFISQTELSSPLQFSKPQFLFLKEEFQS